MQTNISEKYRDTVIGKKADAVLRRCVHCGFCNATCPTYQLRNDELDGPRGRIYQIKQLLEGKPATQQTRIHLDRCLVCRNCESTCPSGVSYGELLDIGRDIVEQQVQRPALDRLQRSIIRNVLAYPSRFSFLLGLGQIFRPLLPPSLRQMVPEKSAAADTKPSSTHSRKILLLGGCVQPGLAPDINIATAQVLHRLGITSLYEKQDGCCGALHHHTSDSQGALDFARQRIDAWWPFIDDGIEAIVSTASGCGVHIKDYGELLSFDPLYKDKARTVSDMTRDIVEILSAEDIEQLRVDTNQRIAFHPPCTLQHGQKLSGKVEQLLQRLGIEYLPFDENHLCCGAAGSYTLLHPEISATLRERKMNNIEASQPDMIVSANIGCIHHLAAVSDRPVRHWIELLAEAT